MFPQLDYCQVVPTSFCYNCEEKVWRSELAPLSKQHPEEIVGSWKPSMLRAIWACQWKLHTKLYIRLLVHEKIFKNNDAKAVCIYHRNAKNTVRRLASSRNEIFRWNLIHGYTGQGSFYWHSQIFTRTLSGKEVLRRRKSMLLQQEKVLRQWIFRQNIRIERENQ